MTTILSDIFTGSSGTIVGRTPAPTQVGSNVYGSIQGTGTITTDGSGHGLGPSSGGDSYVTYDAGVTNCTVSIDITSPASGVWGARVIFRWTNSSSFYRVLLEYDGSGKCYLAIYKNLTKIAGNQDLSGTGLWANGGVTGTMTITLGAAGAISCTYTVGANSSTITATDTAYTGTQFGFGNYGGSGYPSLVFDNFLVQIPAATTATLTGPTAGTVNTASTNFTVTPDDVYTGTITPASSGAGTFSPSSLTFSGSSTPQTFTYTPTSQTGSPHSVSISASPSLTYPGSPISYTVNSASATTATLSGPSSGILNNASTNFSVAVDGNYTGTVTPATSSTGTFSPSSLTWSGTSDTKTFTYTPTTQSGSPHSVSITASPTLSYSGTPVSYTVNLATLTLTGPTSGNMGAASTNFTVTPNASYTGTVTPASSGAGTFSPSSLTFSSSAAQTFTYTATSQTGSPHSVSISASPSANYSGSPISYTVNLLPVTVSITDANVFFSPYNWKFSGSTYAQSTTPGAYSKFKFTGTSAKVNVDVSLNATESAGNYPYIGTRVDGSEQTIASGTASSTTCTLTVNSHGYSTSDVVLVTGCTPLTYNGRFLITVDNANQFHYTALAAPGGSITTAGTVNKSFTRTQLTSSTTQVTAATGLASGTHFLEVILDSSMYNDERWLSASLASVLRITGFEIDNSCATVSQTLRPNRAIIYGDSNCEGYEALGSGIDPTHQSAQCAFSAILGRLLNAEFGVIGFAAEGYTRASGNVPALTGSWDLYYQSNSRLTAGAFTPTPNYVVCNHGQNDVTIDITSTVTGLVGSWRTAAGANALIFCCDNPQTNRESEIAAGVTAASDAKAFNPTAGGIDYTRTTPWYTDYSAHLNPTGHAAYASALYTSIAPLLDVGSVAITSPNGGESYAAGVSVTLTCTTGNASGSVLWEYTANNGSSWTTIATSTVSANAASQAWSTTGLTPGANYKVRATDVADGTITDSSNATFTIATALSAGTLTAGAITATTASFTWTNNTGGSGSVGAQLQKSAHGANTWSNVSGQTTSPATATGLTTGTQIDFRVLWTDSGTVAATATSGTVSQTPALPSVPTLTLARPNVYNQNSLSWTASTGGSLSGYKIYTTPDITAGSPIWTLLADVGNVTSYTHNLTGINNVAGQGYAVTAYDAGANESAKSTAAQLPLFLSFLFPNVGQAFAVGSSVTIDWTYYAGTDGNPDLANNAAVSFDAGSTYTTIQTGDDINPVTWTATNNKGPALLKIWKTGSEANYTTLAFRIGGGGSLVPVLIAMGVL